MPTQVARLSLLSPAFIASKLFRNGEDGCVLDQALLNSVYQTSDGSVAGAAGQLVGRMLDTRNALARGAELLPNGGPAFVNTVGWSSATSTLQILGGELEIGVTGASGAVSNNNIQTAANKTYELLMTLRKGTFTGTTFSLAASTGIPSVTLALSSSATLYRTIFTATASSVNFSIGRLTADTGTLYLSSASIREIPGSHAVQSTAGSRPTLNGSKLDYSSGTKSLVVTFGASLGSTCTVAHAIPLGDASILSGQTIGATYTDTTDHCGLVIVNRDLTSAETIQLRRLLNRRAQ